MGFVGLPANQKSKEERDEEVVLRAQELIAEEPPLIIPSEIKPWRASYIKADCARQVYYARHEPNLAEDRANVSALYGTTVHSMFQHDAPDEEAVFYHLFTEAVQSYGLDSIYDDRINWHASSKPFSLSGFRDSNPELKLWVMFQRYMGLDRVNYTWFWESHPLAVYRHPPTGKLAIEARLVAEIGGEEVDTSADMMLTHLYTGEIIPADWKTGRASEPTQLATYAIAAESFYDLEPESITRGLFIMTGRGECVAPRGKIPEKWIADPENCVAEEDLTEWREVVYDRLRRLRVREETGVWTPRLNPLCHNTCQFRQVCPMGRALQEIKGETT